MSVVAIMPGLRQVRIANRDLQLAPLWRNGGIWGNQPSCLQADPEHDTQVLNDLRRTLGLDFNPASITGDVLILRYTPAQLPRVLRALQRVLSNHEIQIRWFAN
jgi:hypothetical protein